MFTIRFTKHFERQYKKLPASVHKELYQLTDDLQKNPQVGKSLKNNTQGLYSIGFSRKPQYRLLYSFNEIQPEESERLEEGIVPSYFIATREKMNQLYRLSRKQVVKYLNSPIWKFD